MPRIRPKAARLEQIERAVKRLGPTASVERIADCVGLSPASTRWYLNILANRGRVACLSVWVPVTEQTIIDGVRV